jgi:hypothetical protein
MKRVSGSVRFDPYYKLQTWSSRSSVWIDVQKTYETHEAARQAAAEVSDRWRIMVVWPGGRRPVEEGR